MRLAAPAALLLVLAALVAGCGGSSTTTVVRTVTEKAPVEADVNSTAATQEAAEKQAEEEENPSRVVHLKTFRSPSGNIGCALYEGGARCDIRKRDWSPPPRPARCPKQVGYGQGIEVAHNGEAGVGAPERAQHVDLERVHVLVLVDAHVVDLGC